MYSLKALYQRGELLRRQLWTQWRTRRPPVGDCWIGNQRATLIQPERLRRHVQAGRFEHPQCTVLALGPPTLVVHAQLTSEVLVVNLYTKQRIIGAPGYPAHCHSLLGTGWRL